MKPRKTLSVYVLLIGVMGLSIVGGILAFQIFSASVKSQLTDSQREAVKPIDGTIAQVVVNNLQKRRVVTEAELGSILTPTPRPTETVIINQAEATPSAAQTATTSGQVAETATQSGETVIQTQ